MQSTHQGLPIRIAAFSVLLLLTPLSSCGTGQVDQEEAGNLAAEFEAGANNATDETQAQVLREQANSLRELSEGNQAQEDRVKAVGE